jgi:H+/gluconate symporter-like permease
MSDEPQEEPNAINAESLHAPANAPETQSSESPTPTSVKPVTPKWVFMILQILLVVGLIAILVLIMNFDWMDQLKDYLEDHFWESIWKFMLLCTCGLFALMSVLVIVGGALDIRKLFRRLREREASGDSDDAD